MKTKKQMKNFIDEQNSYDYEGRVVTHSVEALFKFSNMDEAKRKLFYKAYNELYTEKAQEELEVLSNYEKEDWSAEEVFDRGVGNLQCKIDGHNGFLNKLDKIVFDSAKQEEEYIDRHTNMVNKFSKELEEMLANKAEIITEKIEQRDEFLYSFEVKAEYYNHLAASAA